MVIGNFTGNRLTDNRFTTLVAYLTFMPDCGRSGVRIPVGKTRERATET